MSFFVFFLFFMRMLFLAYARFSILKLAWESCLFFCGWEVSIKDQNAGGWMFCYFFSFVFLSFMNMVILAYAGFSIFS